MRSVFREQGFGLSASQGLGQGVKEGSRGFKGGSRGSRGVQGGFKGGSRGVQGGLKVGSRCRKDPIMRTRP